MGDLVLARQTGETPGPKQSSCAEAAVRMLASDDAGEHWTVIDPSFDCPLFWWSPCGKVVRNGDGTLVMPVFGAESPEALAATIHGCGLLRSRDGGETWGDFSWITAGDRNVIGAASEARFSFEEPSVQEIPDGRRLAVSSDRGRTWKKTGAALSGVSRQNGIELPDGGVAFTYRTHSWQGPGVVISYDHGWSFHYALTGPYETVHAFAHGEDEFIVFTGKSHRSDMSAGVYQWIPRR